MIDKIIAILKKHEQHLSDGFFYYLPSWHPEYGDIEQDEFLKVIATEILEAMKAEMAIAGRDEDWSSLSWKEPHASLSEIMKENDPKTSS